MGVGTQRDSVHWELLGVELRRENKRHGDCASLTEAAVGGLEPARHQGKRRMETRTLALLKPPPHPPHLKLT